ncbi:MAG: winged helix-turn-helix transcriptional regulator [Bacillota bacterium]
MNDDEISKNVLKELGEIKTYLRFLARGAITTELSKVASTPDRQQIWRLADGSLSNEQIADKVGVSLRAVQYFVEESETKGLIKLEKRGYPRRIEEIIPTEWKPWKPKKSQKSDEQPEATANTD